MFILKKRDVRGPFGRGIYTAAFCTGRNIWFLRIPAVLHALAVRGTGCNIYARLIIEPKNAIQAG